MECYDENRDGKIEVLEMTKFLPVESNFLLHFRYDILFFWSAVAAIACAFYEDFASMKESGIMQYVKVPFGTTKSAIYGTIKRSICADRKP